MSLHLWTGLLEFPFVMPETITNEQQHDQPPEGNRVWEFIKRVTADPVVEPIVIEKPKPLSLKTKVGIGVGVAALTAFTSIAAYRAIDHTFPPEQPVTPIEKTPSGH